jgi:HK97 family phage major capsid protein
MTDETAEHIGGAAALRAELKGFVNDVKGLHAELHERLNKQEDRMSMLSTKSRAPRAPLSTQAETGEAMHGRAFDAYVRAGEEDAMRGLDLEGKSLSTAVAADGGYLVDPRTAETVHSVMQSTASIRAIATVVNVEATSYDVLVDHGELESGWATETGSLTVTGTPQVDRISITLHELSALPKASQRLLDDAAFDIEGWLANRIAERFAIAEADAFVNGDGVNKPRGFLNHTKAADVPNLAWGSLGRIDTGVAGGIGSPDKIVELVYALGARYRANGTFVMNSKTAGLVRKLKDADGRFLWSDGLAAAEPARLLGYPVTVTEAMPDAAPGAYAIAFGDFEAGYTIAERPDLRILRDPFSAKPNVLFYATKRVGGDVTDFAAIKLLRFAA